MKTHASPLASLCGCLLMLLVWLATPPALHAQTTGSPPELMSYQGFLADNAGTALASDRPRNYEVTFRIYSTSSGTAANERIWTERQTVTVDKGYFSILLGQGATVLGESNPSAFSSVFASATASDRFIGLTVTGQGSGGADLVIEPRLRLLPGPYAFLAKNAQALANNAGAQIVTVTSTSVGINKPAPGSALDVNGTVTATAFSGNGAALTSLPGGNVTGTLNTGVIPNLDASKITSGTFGADRIPNLDAGKVTSGTLADARLAANVARRNTAQTFTGQQTFQDGLQYTGDLIMGDSAKFIMRNGPIRLRQHDDPYHALVHSGYYAGGNFGAVGVDGPVLRGWEGGILGHTGGTGGTNNVTSMKWSPNAVEVWGRSANADFAVRDNAYGSAQQFIVRPRDQWEIGMRGNRITFGMAHVHSFEYAGVIQAYAGNDGATLAGTTLRINPLGGAVVANTTQISDRNAKTGFQPVDGKQVLAKLAKMPLMTWAYTNSSSTTHMGPTAQDFKEAFELGDTPLGIATVDAQGVALAAIKGLNEVVREKDEEIQTMKRELQELRALVEGLALQNAANRP